MCRDFGALGDAHVRRRQLRVHCRFKLLLEQRRVQGVAVVDFASEQRVACPQAALLDRAAFLLGELCAQPVLLLYRRLVAGMHAGNFLSDLGGELLRYLGLVLRQLDHLRMLRADPIRPTGALRLQLQQRAMQPLDPGLVEEIGLRVGPGVTQEGVAGLQADPRRFGLGHRRRQVGQPLRDDFLFLVDRDTGMECREGVQRRFGTRDAFGGFLELAAQELLRRDVGGELGFLVGFQKGAGVRRGQERRQVRARGRETDLHQVRAAQLLHRQPAGVAIDQRGIDVGRSDGLAAGLGAAARFPAARLEGVQQAAGERQQAAPLRRRIEKVFLLGEMLAADHSLGQVAALQHCHLGGEEG